MPKLQLQPDAAFKAVVQIPVPGAADAPVEFIFKYRNRSELLRFLERISTGDLTPTAAVMEMASGWDLVDTFSEVSVGHLLDNYLSSFMSIYEKYVDEHTKVRSKN